MIDVASGGTLVEKTFVEERQLILKMTANSQQFRVHIDSFKSKVIDTVSFCPFRPKRFVPSKKTRQNNVVFVSF